MTDPAHELQRQGEHGGDDRADAGRIDLYWRAGCGFCSSLRRQLDALGIERIEHDIWADPTAATEVRRITGGSETVPTVVVGDIELVNPSARQLVAVLTEQAPQLLPAGFEPPTPGRVGRFVERLLGS